MTNPSRRFVAGLIRFGLVILAIALVAGYFKRRIPKSHDIHVATSKSPELLGPGDLRIYSSDSTIDLVLQGDQILAGLSPETVEKIKAKIDSSANKDTSGGLGASISGIVKRSVAGAIGTHAAFPLKEIRAVRYEHGQVRFDWNDGKQREIFENANINGTKVSESFREEDVKRFIEAVRARKGESAAVPPAVVGPSTPAPPTTPH